MLRRAIVGLVGACLVYISTTARGGDERGSLVIIGGALRASDNATADREIWNRVVALAGGENAKIAVFPTASGSWRDSGKRAVTALKRAGAEAFVVPLAVTDDEVDFRKTVVDPELIEQVRNADGVFFTGGDQKRITKALKTAEGENTPLLDAVWEVYRGGGVIAGTSAGAAVLSSIMFSDPDSVLSTLKQGVTIGKEIDQGLGFLDHSWFIEQHCLARGRFARALVAMHSQGLKFGIGVDENTAVVVRHGDEVEVVGSKGAVVLDLSNASHDPDILGFNLKNIRLTYLDHGDTFDLRTLAVTPAKEKQDGLVPMPEDDDLDGDDADGQSGTPVVNDILGDTKIVELLQGLLRGRKREAIGLAFDGAALRKEPTQGFEFHFYPAADSAGWFGNVLSGTGLTVSNIHLDVRPVEIGMQYK